MQHQTPAETCAHLWQHGVALLNSGEAERAADSFEAAVGHDPRAADVWLGLHAAGRRRPEAVDAMYEHRSLLGGLRSRFGVELQSRFDIGLYVTYRLSNVGDVWLAKVAKAIDEDEHDQARAWLESVATEDDQIRFLRARHAFCRQEWQDVVKFARGIEDGFLKDETQLYNGLALALLGMHYAALDALEPLPATLDPGGAFEGEVAFARGLAWEGLGENEKASRAFQHAYRCSPETELFAERAKAPAPAETTSRRRVERTDGPEAATGEQGDLTAEQRSEMLAEAKRQLDGMIGLEPVKQQVKTLTAQFKMAALRQDKGLKAAARPHHFVFAGPPGTGKTTVARIMGEILAGLGLLEHGEVVETQRGDLVGQYLGQTAKQTREKIEAALGGILFIDEAYALSNAAGYAGGKDAFGDEALQEILTAAENQRDRLVIILAGYRQEINELIATNPGLKSRFSTVVDFPSYSAAELTDIAASVCAAAGDEPSAAAEEALATCFRFAADQGMVDDLGNGRFARELCRKAAAQRDLRLLETLGDAEPTAEQMVTIEAADVLSAYRELVPESPFG
ncbi:AAA family ATPase [Glycomyces tenuis]|uniref:AAA family ATPase n=1 Tax=Glycomyces tenuis TaxID=58116 RepID=UPI000403DE17|nr:AAA family ATPase [Glycomyces tenuis]